ncbi:hypothetical protein M0Q97_04230 [Candidatus Dojkabacteria bacterium]|jgi:uncharacterized protein (UPF0332 family)|nr:hypothetical protein [Candidatus Dojkabacteria bacterium]
MNIIDEHKFIRDNVGYDIIEKLDLFDLLDFYENKNIKNSYKTLDEHMYIRETVGYDFIKNVELEDLPQVIQFLEIIWNYTKMKKY